MKRAEEEEPPPPSPPHLYGDILDAVVSHVPTLDLLPASRVSSTWHLAVASSLLRRPRLKPLLLLHLHRNASASLAYDPHSRSWARLAPGLLPLAATWRSLPPPRVARTDPVVSRVGPHLVLAGGTCPFEDLTRAVEVLDPSDPSKGWRLADPLPEELAQSSSATWLSAATSDGRLHVMDKDSGVFASFDPETGKWARACRLKPDPSTRVSAIGSSNGRLILVGLSGEDPDPMRIRMWEVGLGSDPTRFKEMGSMPEKFVKVLTGTGFGLSTIGFKLAGDFGYFYNPGGFSEGGVFWEIVGGKWERVGPPREVDEDPTAKIVFGCERVSFGDL